MGESSQMMTNEEMQTRGWRAKELQDNELLQQALKSIKDEVITQWGACPARDMEGKEQLWQLYKTSQKFEMLLNGYIESGKLATDLISKEQSFTERLLKRIA